MLEIISSQTSDKLAKIWWHNKPLKFEMLSVHLEPGGIVLINWYIHIKVGGTIYWGLYTELLFTRICKILSMSLKCLCIINIFLQRHFVTSTGQQAIQANQSSVVLLQVTGQSYRYRHNKTWLRKRQLANS